MTGKNKNFGETMKRIEGMIDRVRNNELQSMLLSVLKNNGENLTDKNITKFEKIIEAIIMVDRKYFTPFNYYTDEPVIIGRGQTISQPTTVARMLLMIELKKSDNILEAGTGSGWNAALIAYIINPGKVLTYERISELAKSARKNIDKFTRDKKQRLNVNIASADILDETTMIWKSRYNKIIITAGVSYKNVEQIKTIGIRLLKNNGLLLFPSSEIGSYGALELWQKKGNKLKLAMRDEGYAFVPLLQKVE
jgi:protein-L-isoaspartate(D-aspartate) O-methyltransferase